MKTILILMISFVLSVSNINAQQTQSEKPQNQKIENKNNNDCPVACNKNCKKDPKTCKKAQKVLKKLENKKNKENENDSSEINKTKKIENK